MDSLAIYYSIIASLNQVCRRNNWMQKGANKLKDAVKKAFSWENKGGSNTINPQLINSQSELSKDYFDTLQSNGTLTSGGRSGGTTPQTAPANSYYITDGGHVVIYGQDGIKVMDISSERIKIYKFNQKPNNPNLGNWSDRKLKDSNGMIDKTAQWILDYFGIK